MCLGSAFLFCYNNYNSLPVLIILNVTFVTLAVVATFNVAGRQSFPLLCASSPCMEKCNLWGKQAFLLIAVVHRCAAPSSFLILMEMPLQHSLHCCPSLFFLLCNAHPFNRVMHNSHVLDTSEEHWNWGVPILQTCADETCNMEMQMWHVAVSSCSISEVRLLQTCCTILSTVYFI